MSLDRLPIIDVSPFLDPALVNSDERAAAAAALHSACVEYGFFYLDIRAFVDPAETEELTRLARDFFALSEEEKDKISLKNQDSARGVNTI